jgi:hypothetical protein
MAPTSYDLHSQDLPGGRFAPHGSFRVRWLDGVVWWDNHGPFNLEALQRYNQMRQVVREQWLLPGQWIAGVVHWHGSALMSPEAFDEYRQAFERVYRQPHRLVAVAWVTPPDLEGMDLMRRRWNCSNSPNPPRPGPARSWWRGEVRGPEAPRGAQPLGLAGALAAPGAAGAAGAPFGGCGWRGVCRA